MFWHKIAASLMVVGSLAFAKMEIRHLVEGDYTKVSGDENLCPDIDVELDQKERLLNLGSTYVFPLKRGKELVKSDSGEACNELVETRIVEGPSRTQVTMTIETFCGKKLTERLVRDLRVEADRLSMTQKSATDSFSCVWKR